MSSARGLICWPFLAVSFLHPFKLSHFLLLPKLSLLLAFAATLAFPLSLHFVDKKMSTQKILINYAEFKKLKEIEKRYYELQTQVSGITTLLLTFIFA